MAIVHRANTIVCDAGPNTIPGPIDWTAIVCTGSTTVAKGGNTIMTLAAGDHLLEFRSASDITVTGACTIVLRLSRHD